jgi:hypothetical protein
MIAGLLYRTLTMLVHKEITLFFKKVGRVAVWRMCVLA